MTARRGMTLMELIVALALTGLMAAMGVATFGSIIDHRRVIVASTSDTERAAALRDQVRTWLLAGTVQIQTGGVPRGGGRATTVTTPTVAGGRSATTASGTAAVSAAVSSGDELTFTTTAPNPADAPSVRMRLFIDADDNTPESGLTLEFQASTSLPLQRIELERSIGALTVEFLDQRTNQWIASSQAAAITPIALRLSLHGYDNTRVPGILEVPMIFPMGTLLVGR